MGRRKMHPDEVETDPDLVRSLLARQFPQWAGLPLARVDSAGTENALFRLGTDMVVRLPRRSGAADKVEHEQRWLPRLAPRLPVAIPAPLALGKPEESFPWPWSVYAWLDGEDAATGQIDDPTRFARDLAGFVAALKRIDAAGVPPAGYGRGGPLAASTRDAYVRERLPGIEPDFDVRAVTEAWEAALRAPAWDRPPVWVHGDLIGGNVLLVDGRLSAVIDFGAAGRGDPACDVMAAWTLLTAETRKVFRAALDVDDATWARSMGWALSFAVLALPYYRRTNPVLAGIARRAIGEVLADRKGIA